MITPRDIVNRLLEASPEEQWLDRNMNNLWDPLHPEKINPAYVDFLVIHGVQEDDDQQCWVDDVNPKFFSVYAKDKEGYSDCVGDFDDLEKARAYAAWLFAQYGKDNMWNETEDFLA